MSEDSDTRLADKREAPVRIVLPYKDQKSANVVRKQLTDLSRKINAYISPVHTSKKIKDEIKVREDKPPLVSQKCVVYSFQCGLSDAGYVGLKKWQSAHFAKAVVRQNGQTWSIFLAELQSTKHARIKGNYPVVGSWSK